MHCVFNACLCFHVRMKFSSSTPLVLIAHAEMQKMTITHAGKYVRPLQKQQPNCNHQFRDHIMGAPDLRCSFFGFRANTVQCQGPPLLTESCWGVQSSCYSSYLSSVENGLFKSSLHLLQRYFPALDAENFATTLITNSSLIFFM